MLHDLLSIAKGLNIEGYKPTLTLPENAKWYNIILAIDEPLKGDAFETVMQRVKDNDYQYIEEAVGIDIVKFLTQMTQLIKRIASQHSNLLVHVHQYKGTTILDRILEELSGIKCILDETNFFESPTNYEEKYPDIDSLLSISQCAGLGVEAGTYLVANNFYEFNIESGTIDTTPVKVSNDIAKHLESSGIEHQTENILIVNDLWNPDVSKNITYVIN